MSSIDSVAAMTSGAELARRPVCWIREHPLAADSILAALLTTLALALHFSTSEIDDQPAHTPTWWTVALILLATLPVMFRRRSPVWTLAVVLTGQLAVRGLARVRRNVARRALRRGVLRRRPHRGPAPRAGGRGRVRTRCSRRARSLSPPVT